MYSIFVKFLIQLLTKSFHFTGKRGFDTDLNYTLQPLKFSKLHYILLKACLFRRLYSLQVNE